MEDEGAGAVLGGSSDEEYSQHGDDAQDSRSERSASPPAHGAKKAKTQLTSRSLDEEEDEEALALRLLTGGR
jgi:hypothetical protein